MLPSGQTRVLRGVVIIKPTHRGLWYEDGVLKRVLEQAMTSCATSRKRPPPMAW